MKGEKVVRGWKVAIGGANGEGELGDAAIGCVAIRRCIKESQRLAKSSIRGFRGKSTQMYEN